MVNVRREREGGTMARTARSVGGTPTGSPRRKDGRILPNVGDKGPETLQIAWTNEMVREQEREDRLEKEERERERID